MLYSFSLSPFEMNSDLNEKLFKAVSKGDYNQVRSFLSAGADANFIVKEWCGETTLLHYAPTAEIVKELLSHGAEVDAKDYNGKTPLMNAVSQKKDLSVIIELLENGADPNARSIQGTTALTPAITNRNLEMIKVLLDHGADMNIKTTSPLLRYPTPLAIAISAHEACAKLLIKHSLVKHFDSEYIKVINLDMYAECINYRMLSDFLEDCVCEIIQMKTENANDNFSLHDFVLVKTACIKSLYDRFIEKDKQILIDFPIYHDLIFHKVDLYLQRVFLLEKFTSFHIFISSKDGLKSDIILNSDCLLKIAEYLSNKELFRFVAAFDNNLDLSYVSLK